MVIMEGGISFSHCCIVQMAVVIRKIVMYIYYHCLLFSQFLVQCKVLFVLWGSFMFCVCYVFVHACMENPPPPFFNIHVIYTQTELTLANKPTLPSVFHSIHFFFVLLCCCCCLYFPWSSHGIAYNNRSIFGGDKVVYL